MSAATTVMPTGVPAAAPSAILLGTALLSTGVDGATSVTAMTKLCELVAMPSFA